MTQLTNLARSYVLSGIVVAAISITAFFVVRTQIGPSAFGCSEYMEIANSEDFRDSIHSWARREFRDVSLNTSSLPAGYQLSNGPGIVEVLDVSGLDFFPEDDQDLRVRLEIDSSGNVAWVFVGRTGRAGLIVYLRGAEPDNFAEGQALVETFGPVAVYCND